MSYVNLSVQEETRTDVKKVIKMLNKRFRRKNVSYDEALRYMLNSLKNGGGM